MLDIQGNYRQAFPRLVRCIQMHEIDVYQPIDRDKEIDRFLLNLYAFWIYPSCLPHIKKAAQPG